MLQGHFFFFNDTATTEIYTLSLHAALPISRNQAAVGQQIEPLANGVAADRKTLDQLVLTFQLLPERQASGENVLLDRGGNHMRFRAPDFRPFYCSLTHRVTPVPMRTRPPYLSQNTLIHISLSK